MYKRILSIVLVLIFFCISISLANAQQGEEPGFEIRSVDVMTQTQDAVCEPPSDSDIEDFVRLATELGANYIAISTPYDDPACGSSLDLTTRWVTAIRKPRPELSSVGMNVWHRHKFLSYEEFYGVPKPKNPDPFAYLPLIYDYIIQNPALFAEGDIFTPTPEPQNGGIHGVTYCGEENICQFESADEFNRWIVEAVQTSEAAFAEIDLTNIKVGYWGWDGFLLWSDRNPDHDGFVMDDTVLAADEDGDLETEDIPEQEFGQVTVDHYFPFKEVPDPAVEVANMVAQLNRRFPGAEICIGEWGATEGQPVEYVRAYMQAVLDAGITCFNYWNLFTGGQEALVVRNEEGELVTTPYYDVVQQAFSR